jgi:hypothetical protein
MDVKAGLVDGMVRLLGSIDQPAWDVMCGVARTG